MGYKGKKVTPQQLSEKVSQTDLNTKLASVVKWKPNEVPVLIMLGQSNCDGRGVLADAPILQGTTWNGEVKIFNKSITRNPANSAVNRVDNGSWVNLDYDHLMVVSPAGTQGFGSELPLALSWKNTYPGTPLYIIKCAIGGTPLASRGGGSDTDWSSNSGQIWDLAYNWVVRPALKSLLASGKIPKCVGVTWIQGETDADGTGTLAQAQAYETNLRDLITNRIRGKLGFPNAKVLISGLHTYNYTWGSYIKNAQINVCEGANKLDNCVLLRSDGSDGSLRWVRYMSNVRAGDQHYTPQGYISMANAIFKNLDLPGSNYSSIYDFELVAANISDIPTSQIESVGLLGPLAIGNYPLATGTTKSITWVRDPGYLDRLNGTTGLPDATIQPAPRIKILPLVGATDQEIIFQLAHDADGSTKPGVVMRGSWSNVGANDVSTGYLVQVRNGGTQLTIFKRVSNAWVALGASPVTPSQSPTTGNLYWYKVTLIGQTLTVYNSPDGITWTQQFQVTDSTYASGDTWFTMYNGLADKAGTVPAITHAHFPVLLARKL
jgi:hypothetical protein